MDFAGLLGIGDEPPPLRFVVIGGYAVNAHGYTRATFDVDFLIQKEDRAAWIERLLGRELRIFRESENFVQFAQPEGDPLDLMLVRHETFEQFWRASEIRSVGSLQVRVPALDHLLALKLHALKQQSRHRTFKDADDVETLVRLNKVDLTTSRYEELFLKYGSREIYETIKRITRS
jgi:hypothetical protein